MKSLVNCHQCSAQFLKLNYRIKSSERHYCSRKCFGQDRIYGRWRNHEKKIKFCKSCDVLIDKRNEKGHCRDCSKRLGLNTRSKAFKKDLSEKRKAYLKNNPDKHPWKLKTKFKSEPCESFKKILTDNNYKFLEEFTPTDSHSYSIDIVFPEKMIGIEINGNQHYERNGKLKKYYQDRHDYIESHGWKLYEVHYSLCFDERYILGLVNEVMSVENKIEFNHEEYIQKKLEKKSKYDLCQCGQKKGKEAKLCVPCDIIKRRKVKWPSKSELHNLIWSTPNAQLAKRFGVSDVAIAKWCKLYKIKKPDRGFWAKYEAKQILDYQI